MKLLGTVVLAVALASPAALASTSRTVTVDRALDQSVVQRINEVREQNGLPPLRVSFALQRAAVAHTREMVAGGYFAHESSDGSPFWKRVRHFYGAKGFRMWTVGENLVWGTPELTSDDAVEDWLRSPEHRANILSAAWREIGLAAVHVASAPGAYGDLETTVVTADFGARSK